MLISDFHESELPDLENRNIKIPFNTGKIITLIGVRRSGKTFTLFELINNLTKKIPKEFIVYINFEDERLDLNKENFQDIINAYVELFPENKLKDLHFIFDEIQEIEGWEKFVRRVYDSISKNIYLTGSSSKLLSKEIATSLRGRTLTYEIFPLSFKEYLDFKNINSDKYNSTKQKAIILNAFKEYLEKGGFPETINFENDILLKTLQNYYEVMIYRDIIERYNISNPELLKRFIQKGINNISKEFSINKTHNEIKSEGLKTSKDTLYNFSKYLEDIFLLFYVPKYDESIKKQTVNPKKIYCIDTGLVNSVSFKFSEEKGRLLENIVFLHLRRNNFEIFYHRDKSECDFIVKQKDKIGDIIQVSWSLRNEDVKNREINGLLEAMKLHKKKKGLILTLDEEDEIQIENKKIQIIPVWKWILETNI